MTYAPSSHKFAMGIGVAGAMIEVTADVRMNEGGVTRRWGRQSTFSDTTPGQFAFTLDNRDGKYTPGNVNSPLATKVTEGMRVSWELNGTLRSGKISGTQLIFPSEGKADAARLRVTVSDVLADAARTDIDSVVQAVVLAAKPYAYWPMDDALGTLNPREASGNGVTGMRVQIPELAGAAVNFGVDSARLGWSQAELLYPTTALTFDGSGLVLAPGIGPFGYPSSSSLGVWSLWVTRGTDQSAVSIWPRSVDGSGTILLIHPNMIQARDDGGYVTLTNNTLRAGTPVHVSISGSAALVGPNWVSTWTFYFDGVVSPITVSTTHSSDPRAGRWEFYARTFAVPSDPPQRILVSHVSWTPALISMEGVSPGATAAQRLRAIVATLPGLVLDTVPSDFSVSSLGACESGSALDLFNTVIRGEQGHIWSVTSGALLAPVEKVKVRARTRPEAVTSSFSTSTDIEGAPDLQRNTTNMVSAVTVTGPNGKVTVYQRDLEARVGSANASASVALANSSDLEAFGQDRILRGINRGIDVVSFNIDPGGASTNRWAELMDLTPGLRYRVADLPVAQLGVSTWDGWFLGAAESHDGDRSMFTLYFEPVLDRTAVYDTDRFMAGGVLSLSSNITNAATSMSIATSVPGTVFTTAGGDLPVDVVMGTEQMRVTAVTGATPQVFTVTRGVNGTAATSHTSGELLELVTNSLYAY